MLKTLYQWINVDSLCKYLQSPTTVLVIIVIVLLCTGCSSTMLKSTVDYRALQIANEAIAAYDDRLDDRIGTAMETRIRVLIRNELGNTVIDMLPWGLGSLAGGGWLASAAKKRRDTNLGTAQKSDNKEP